LQEQRRDTSLILYYLDSPIRAIKASTCMTNTFVCVEKVGG
jgi:hypothetical protein